VVEEVRKYTEEQRGADVAIEAVGLPEVWEETLLMVRKGGRVILFGGCETGTKVSLDTSLIHLFSNKLERSFPPYPWTGQKGPKFA